MGSWTSPKSWFCSPKIRNQPWYFPIRGVRLRSMTVMLISTGNKGTCLIWQLKYLFFKYNCPVHPQMCWEVGHMGTCCNVGKTTIDHNKPPIWEWLKTTFENGDLGDGLWLFCPHYSRAKSEAFGRDGESPGGQGANPGGKKFLFWRPALKLETLGSLGFTPKMVHKYH